MMERKHQINPDNLKQKPDLSLVLPCYNEEDVIRNTATRLIKAFQDNGINIELILVDNGSADRTGEIIDQMSIEGMPIVKETVKKNIGYGNGILRGLSRCNGTFVGFMCADGQVEAQDVVRVYDISSNSKTPYLVKVRRRFRMDGLVRKGVSILYNGLATIIFGGLGSIDINGNPKIFPAEYLPVLNLNSTDWFLDAEVMIKAKKLGLKVFELNVMAQMREGGKSNVRGSTIREFLKNIIKYRFNEDILGIAQTKRLSESEKLAR